MRGVKKRPLEWRLSNYGRVWRKGAGKEGLVCDVFNKAQIMKEGGVNDVVSASRTGKGAGRGRRQSVRIYE